MGERHAQAVARSGDIPAGRRRRPRGRGGPRLGERAGVAACADLAALCADPDVALVVVAVPTSCHAESARAALAAGQHVLCEKPLPRAPPRRRTSARAPSVPADCWPSTTPYRHAAAFRRLRGAARRGRARAAASGRCSASAGAAAIALEARSRQRGRGGPGDDEPHGRPGGVAVRTAASTRRCWHARRSCRSGASRARSQSVDGEDYAVAELRYDGSALSDRGRSCLAMVRPARRRAGRRRRVVGSLVDDVPTRLYLDTARGAQQRGWSALEEPTAAARRAAGAAWPRRCAMARTRHWHDNRAPSRRRSIALRSPP